MTNCLCNFLETFHRPTQNSAHIIFQIPYLKNLIKDWLTWYEQRSRSDIKEPLQDVQPNRDDNLHDLQLLCDHCPSQVLRIQRHLPDAWRWDEWSRVHAVPSLQLQQTTGEHGCHSIFFERAKSLQRHRWECLFSTKDDRGSGSSAYRQNTGPGDCLHGETGNFRRLVRRTREQLQFYACLPRDSSSISSNIKDRLSWSGTKRETEAHNTPIWEYPSHWDWDLSSRWHRWSSFPASWFLSP